MPKKSWEKPQLIALVRSRPEEQILSACKTVNSSYGVGPSSNIGGCSIGAGGYGACIGCAETPSS